MATRIAFFATKDEVESVFNLDTKKEIVFEANYNISPGQQIPVIFAEESVETLNIKRVRWGSADNGKTKKTTLHSDELEAFTKNEKTERCIIPLSGFFVWKNQQELDQPFFVRMLNNSVMVVAGIFSKSNGEEFVSIITTESNPLIQPMSENMPLLLDKVTALQWLDSGSNPEHVLESAGNLFLLTDLSVLRVSKNVNDAKNNSPELIQPIPK
jgi:putative SOS response-associated peptidase YedK